MTEHTHGDIAPECTCEQTSYKVPAITNKFEASETLYYIASHIHGLLESLDEDMEDDRPRLYAQFNALAEYLDKR